MPVVLREGPYTVRFFSDEGGEPPHVHVDGDRSTAKVWLAPRPELAASRGFQPRELREILELVARNRERCLAAWASHFGAAP